MKRYALTLLLLLLPGILLVAQESLKEKKNFRLPRGYICEVFKRSDPGTIKLIYISDSGTATLINSDLTRWIVTKNHSIRAPYPGDRLVWASSIDENGEDNYENATVLRAADNKTGRIAVLDTCAKENDIALIDLSPDGRRILYKVLFETHCILKVSDWRGRITEFPFYREFERYNQVFWINNEEILIQEEIGLLVWNLRLGKVTPLMEKRDLGFLSDCSVDGKVLFSIPDGVDGILDTATGKIEYLPSSGDGYYNWSPDGKRIYLFLRDEDNNQTLSLLDRTTGETKLLITWSPYYYYLGFIKGGSSLLLLEDDYRKYENGLFPIWELDLLSGKWINISERIGYYWVGPRACPHLYYSDGNGWILDSEVLGQSNRKGREGSDRKTVPRERIIDGILTIRITENLYETTWLDSVTLRAGDREILSDSLPFELKAQDGNYSCLKRGDFIELRFVIPPGSEGELYLDITGYYEPGP